MKLEIYNSIVNKKATKVQAELKDNREVKVVIRDPKDSSLNIIKKIGKVFSWLFKCLSFLILIPVIIFFILCIVMLVYSLFYITKGLFFNGIMRYL